MQLREYQARTIDRLMSWWSEHDGVPIVSVPTGGGKSVIIAELVRKLWEQWPDHHPRTVVIVPSKELAEQNAAKLRAMLPASLRVGYYSASMGQKSPDADVIVATIGSVYKAAHLLGNIKCVVIDECHRVNNAGTGQYRQFLSELARYCTFRCVGYTATEYRGDGSWLTSGAKPFFTGIACKIKMGELLDSGYLSPLVIPDQAVKTKISTSGVRTTNGDYNIGELSDVVGLDLPKVADEAVLLATNRKKWIAFTPAVINADALSDLLNERGIHAAVVCGETPADIRAGRIEAFRRGELRCLVTVLALAVGFDVPDIDCIVWVRPTKSPVLYVQGAGRGLRIADGKTNCLWLDFTDTTAEHGPIDTVKGRTKGEKKEETGAPVKRCHECGEAVPIGLPSCPACGTLFPVPPPPPVALSFAPVLSTAVNSMRVKNWVWSVHTKKGTGKRMLKCVYYGKNMLDKPVTEFFPIFHDGYVGKKAMAAFINIEDWSRIDSGQIHYECYIENGTLMSGRLSDCAEIMNQSHLYIPPHTIKYTMDGKYPRVIDRLFN